MTGGPWPPLPWRGTASAGLQVVVHPALGALPAAARQALREAGEGDPCLGEDWFAIFEREVPAEAGERDEWWTLERDGQAVLVLPLRRRPGPGGGALTALANYYTPCFAPAGRGDAASLQALLEPMRRGPMRAAQLALAPLAADAPSTAALDAALRAHGWLLREQEATANWVLPIDAEAAAIWAARPGALRNTARRMGRRFAQDGGRLEILQGAAAVERGLDAYQAVYARSWKQAEAHPGFVPALLALAAERGWLRLGVAWMGERPVAVQAWLVHAGVAAIHKLAYDEEAAKWSPGTLLGQALLAHVIDVDRVRLVDYLTGDDDYKRLWMTERRSRRRLSAWRPWTVAAWRERLRRWVRDDGAAPEATGAAAGITPQTRSPAASLPPSSSAPSPR